MSSLTGGGNCIATPPLLLNPPAAAPTVTGKLSTQFNATFGPSATPGLGMLNLLMFG